MASDLAKIIRSLAEEEIVAGEDIRAALPEDADAADAIIGLAARLTSLKQRSTELRAVMSSTRELLSNPDADLLLQRIVDRAHALMEVDVAYLSVHDPETDQLYVRAATGVVSPDFLDMVVPAGVGLASLAVRTRRPQWVEDYAAHAAVPHDPTIDQTVRTEGLRALLGAPLVVGDRVLGVLFAARRDPHIFRPEAVAVLSTFASHAALVLHLAQLLRKATEATAEADARQRDAEWAAALHGELTRLVVFGHSADAVVHALSDALGRAVVFIDGDGAAIGGDPVEMDDGDLRDAVRAAGESGRSVLLDSGVYEVIAPVIAATARPGALLVARGDRPLTAVERRTVERSALTAALVMLRANALDDAEERVRGELAAELLEGPARREAGLVRAGARGYPVDEPWTLAAIPCAEDERVRVLATLRAHDDWFVAPAPLGVTVLVPHGHRGAVETGALLQDVIGATYALVVALPRDSLADAAAAAATLWQTTRLAQGLGISHGSIDATSLAPYAMLFDGDGRSLAGFVTSMLAPVREWDAAHGSVLLDTLGTLCDQHWSLAATARAMQIHSNTMKQRMQRLRVLLGDDVDRPEARFRLELALRIEQARKLTHGT